MSDIYNDFDVVLDNLKHYSQDIDNMRSLVNISQSKNKIALQAIASAATDNQIGDLLSQINASSGPTDYQESRFSTFCRMIGFPVISQSGEFFNPGYDKTRKNNSKTYQITANQSSIANDFFDAREEYYNTTIKSFLNSSGITIDQSVLLLQTAYAPAMFNVFSNTIGFASSFVPKFYTYNLPQNDTLNNPFSSYTDSLGNAATPMTSFSHFIYPLVTDGRIELTMMPSVRKTTVPFVGSNDTIYGKTELRRPFLEQIIVDRFYTPANIAGIPSVNILQSGNTTVDSFVNDKYLVLSSNKQVQLLYNSVTTNIGRFSDSEYLNIARFFYTLEKLIDLWIENQKIIEETREMYYWLPLSTKNTGPEFGVKSNTLFSNSLSTSKDIEMIQMIATVQGLQLVSGLSTSAITKDKYAFSQFISIFAPEKVSGFKSVRQENIDSETAHRTEQMQKAEAALQNIEYICGTFSGLGLIDIHVILSAMYLMDKNNLLGFLDDDAFTRAQQNYQNITLPTAKPALTDAYQDLETQISQLYQFVYSTYDAKKSNTL